MPLRDILSTISQKPTFVFVHGMIGFQSIGIWDYKAAFFRGVPKTYRELGLKAVFPRVSNLASVKQRAKDLADFIERENLTRVVLVGASMGGLDARYFTSRLDHNERVCAVVSVGTPHRGSPVAEKVLKGLWPGRFLAPVTASDLSTSSSDRFNAEITDRPGVQYFSYAGMRPGPELPLWMRPMGRCVEQAEGANDGLVSVRSATWGRFLGSVRADHFELVGWSLWLPDRRRERPFKHLEVYRRVAMETLNGLKA